jgi:hypothetical protein
MWIILDEFSALIRPYGVEIVMSCALILSLISRCEFNTLQDKLLIKIKVNKETQTLYY